MDKLLEAAIEGALKAGAEHVDVRWSEHHRQSIYTRGHIVSSVEDNYESGINVRAFYNGYSGFVATGHAKSKDEAYQIGIKAGEIAYATAKISDKPRPLSPVSRHKIDWHSPMKTDPFSIPIRTKINLLLEITKELESLDTISESVAHMQFLKTEKLYMNSIGSRIRQTIVISDVDYTAIAVGNGRFETRSFQSPARAEGWELIESALLIENLKRIGREAKEQLKAKPFSAERTDLVLLPTHTRLVIHETIGHATELDRVLGWETDYSGTSFATTDQLNKLQYGSSLLNVTGDRNRPGSMATCAFDDEGIPTGKWYIIKNGLLVDYSTTRETASFIGAKNSHGCAYSDNWSSIPILRMANICIEPGDHSAPSFDDLIADTKDGLLIDGMDSFSIDQQRINFQFTGDFCRKIHNGKIQEVVQPVIYEGSNPLFWNSLDAVCNENEWRPFGIMNCAKGQPIQTAMITHGSPPVRLRNIKVRRRS